MPRRVVDRVEDERERDHEARQRLDDQGAALKDGCDVPRRRTVNSATGSARIVATAAALALYAAVCQRR